MTSKGYKRFGMEGFIARYYDKTARRYMMGLYQKWADGASQRLRDNSAVLEIAPGPGLLAIELARLRPLKVIGLEISRTFVEIARANARTAGVDVEFQEGDVASMPFKDEAFDFIMCTSSFKNFAEPQRALDEMYRVLKSGSKAWISDLRHDVSDGAIDTFVKNEMKMSGLGGAFMRYSFKRMLRPRALTRAQFEELVSLTQFNKATITENEVDLEVLLEK
jgi:ubiquinone/menaquinone biosynthesis C-methylase UbiE